MRQILGKGTLKVLINLAYTLCLSKRRIVVPRKSISGTENYRHWLVKQIIKKVLDGQTNKTVPTVTINLPNDDSHCAIKTPLICLPHKGKQDENLIRSLKNTLDKVLPQDVEPKFIYTGTK